MITYSKTLWGLHLILRVYGSALPRAVPFATISAALTAVLHYTLGSTLYANNTWRHPYPYQVFVYLVSFILVFRSNFSYQRYWDGRSSLQRMTARWADFCTQVCNFDESAAILQKSGLQQNGSEPVDSAPQKQENAMDDVLHFKEAMVHLVSLLHGIALQHLRGDWDLANLQQQQPTDKAPVVDAKGLHSQGGMQFRFSVIDLFILRATPKRRATYNRAVPLGIIGGVTKQEEWGLGAELKGQGSLEGETLWSGRDSSQPVPHRWSCFGKLSFLSTGMYVPGAAERLNTVYSWVQQLLLDRAAHGGVAVPSPIISRSWQILSEGLVSFEECRALNDTPFPFPWAQMVLVFLLMFSLSIPFTMAAWIEAPWLSVPMTFIVVLTYWGLNEVARDLEDPFCYDPNDLPLARIQFQFNQRIMAAARTRWPHTSDSSSAWCSLPHASHHVGTHYPHTTGLPLQRLFASPSMQMFSGQQPDGTPDLGSVAARGNGNGARVAPETGINPHTPQQGGKAV